MAWLIKLSSAATRDLSKLDKPAARRITDFLRDRIAPLDDPRSLGDALKGPKLGELWRYRVGEFRIIASIEDHELCILVVKVGNRRDVYRR